MLSNIIDEPQADPTNSQGAGTTQKYPAHTYGMPHDGPLAGPVTSRDWVPLQFDLCLVFRWYALKEPIIVSPY